MHHYLSWHRTTHKLLVCVIPGHTRNRVSVVVKRRRHFLFPQIPDPHNAIQWPAPDHVTFGGKGNWVDRRSREGQRLKDRKSFRSLCVGQDYIAVITWRRQDPRIVVIGHTVDLVLMRRRMSQMRRVGNIVCKDYLSTVYCRAGRKVNGHYMYCVIIIAWPVRALKKSSKT